MAKIRIMSDSTADIPRDLQKELDITVLPLTIIDGDKEYLDDVTITTKEFYQILEECEKLPSSSRVGMGLFTEQYEKSMEGRIFRPHLHLPQFKRFVNLSGCCFGA